MVLEIPCGTNLADNGDKGVDTAMRDWPLGQRKSWGHCGDEDLYGISSCVPRWTRMELVGLLPCYPLHSGLLVAKYQSCKVWPGASSHLGELGRRRAMG